MHEMTPLRTMKRTLIRPLRRLESRHRAWRYRWRIDRAEIAWMRQVLREGDVVVDAGAYKGGYTYWMRRAVGERGAVHAFEPQPKLARFLVRWVNLFEWKNVAVHELALGVTPGQRMIRVPGEGPSQRGSLVVERRGADEYPVRVETLDDVLVDDPRGRPVSFLKCDVEGHELAVLRGAARILVEDRPTLLFEHEARFCPSGDAGKVFDHLEALGYRGSFFWKGELLPIRDFRFDVHQVEGRKPYANNFAFQPV